MFNFEDSFFEGITGGSARHILGFMACRWGWKDQRQGSTGGDPPLVGHGDFYLCNRGVGIPPTSVMLIILIDVNGIYGTSCSLM